MDSFFFFSNLLYLENNERCEQVNFDGMGLRQQDPCCTYKISEPSAKITLEGIRQS